MATVNHPAAGPRRPWARMLALATGLAGLGCGASNSERPFAPDAGGGSGPGEPSGDGRTSQPPPSGDGGAGEPSVGGNGGQAGSGGGAGGSGQGMDAGAGQDGGAACAPEIPPVCDDPPPEVGPNRSWRNFGSNLVAVGGARHRGRDLFVSPDGPQWIIARFAYGAFEVPLVGEEIDVYLLRGCSGAWEKLDTFTTTSAGSHPVTEGVEDSGGWTFIEIPAARRLAGGRHRVHLVVAGDGSSTELFLEVARPGTPVFVSDIDGTLTPDETAEFGALLTGAVAQAQQDAAAVLDTLVGKGYRPLYLTARPAWLLARTREFLSVRGFPAGIVHTTLGATGALGADAQRFKTDELARLEDKELAPAFAFGNTDTDAEAYATAGIPADRRILYRYTDQTHGSRRVEDYGELLPDLKALPPACPP